MSNQSKLKCFSLRCLTGMAIVCTQFGVHAQAGDNKVVAAPPAKAPAAKPPLAKPPVKPGTAGTVKPPVGIPGHPGLTLPGRPVQKPIQPATKAQQPIGRQTQKPPIVPPQVKQPTIATQTKTLPNGTQMTTRNGRVSDIKVPNSNLLVHRNIAGGQHISMQRPDGSRLYAERGRPSYIEHSYNYQGREYGRRSYYYNGRVYDRYYRPYRYRGVLVESYAPPYYYTPYYYGWVYNPWTQPVNYTWGWNAQPWSGYYGGYFAPATVYPTASLWLTDYMISQSLAASYAARTAATDPSNVPSSAPSSQLSPETKQLISDEVQRQVALENDEAAKSASNQEIDPSLSGIGRTLSDGSQHVFLAGRSIDVVDATGLECAVTEGDVLRLNGPLPPGAATSADLVVLASKGDPDCHPGLTVSVAFDEIQEMQNHMRETIDQGMTVLHDQNGKNGIPPLPPSARPDPVKTAFAAQAPPPDPNGAADIDRQLKEADKAVKEIPPANASPATTAVAQTAGPTGDCGDVSGKTTEQVFKACGKPANIETHGPKKVLVYPDFRLTVVNNKVTSVD